MQQSFRQPLYFFIAISAIVMSIACWQLLGTFATVLFIMCSGLFLGYGLARIYQEIAKGQLIQAQAYATKLDSHKIHQSNHALIFGGQLVQIAAPINHALITQTQTNMLPSAAYYPEPVAQTTAAPIGNLDLAMMLSNWRPEQDNILLAVNTDGQKLYMPISKLFHIALAGSTGNGKTNLMRLLLSQLLACGSNVYLADPHFTPYDKENNEDWQPIAARLADKPATKIAAIGELLNWLAFDELEKRLALRYDGKATGNPIFLALDEYPVIAAGLKNAPEAIGKILREGRKVKIFAIASSQDFLLKTTGGSSGVRECFRTAFYVGGDPYTARTLLDLKGNIDDSTLGRGTAMLRCNTAQTATIHVPFASNEALYKLLGNPTKSYSGNYNEPSNNYYQSPQTSREYATPRQRSTILLPAPPPALTELQLAIRAYQAGAKTERALATALNITSTGRAHKLMLQVKASLQVA